MKINIKESTMIKPAQDLPKKRLWLSNLDLLQEGNHVPSLYFYKSNECSISFDANKVLKEAMSKVLVHFYPVAGRFGRDNKGRLEINCNGEGVMFIEAVTDSTIEELGDLMVNVEVPQLIPSTVHSSMDISSFPLLLVQVTTFKCGGLSMGLRMSHTLADGVGALHFINAWGDMARGLPITVSPFMDRTILQSQVPPNPKFQHIEYDSFIKDTSSTAITAAQYLKDQSDSNKVSSIEIFSITPEQINDLKNKVNNNSTNSSKTKYSTYQILVAHIWRSVCKARGLSGDQKTELQIIVDGRSKLHPPVPLGYFGNAIFGARPIASSGDLLSETLNESAERINKMIKRMDDEYLRSVIDYLEMVNNEKKEFVFDSRIFACPNLGITSWMWLPFYEFDFGMGKPICMRPADPMEGLGLITPTPSSDDGSWGLAICLEKDHMQSFKKLFYEF